MVRLHLFWRHKFTLCASLVDRLLTSLVSDLLQLFVSVSFQNSPSDTLAVLQRSFLSPFALDMGF